MMFGVDKKLAPSDINDISKYSGAYGAFQPEIQNENYNN
jgi:hypothetical protein